MYTQWHFFFIWLPYHHNILLSSLHELYIAIIKHESSSNFPRIFFLHWLFLQPIILYCKKSIRYPSVTQYLSPKISGRIMNTFVKVLMWRTAEYCYTFFELFKIRCKGRKVSTLIYSILIYWCFNLSNCPSPMPPQKRRLTTAARLELYR